MTFGGKAKQGFTLTEIAIVLGIMGIVLAGLWMAAASVSEKRKTQDAAEMVLQIADNVKNLYEGHASAGAPSFAQQVQTGLFPKTALNAAGTATINPWGGTYALSFTAGSLYGVSVTVAMPAGMQAAQSREACISLLTRLKPTGPAQGMVAGAPVSNNPSSSLVVGGGQGANPVAAYLGIGGAFVEVTNDTILEATNRLTGNSCTSVAFYFPI